MKCSSCFFILFFNCCFFDAAFLALSFADVALLSVQNKLFFFDQSKRLPCRFLASLRIEMQNYL